MNLKPIKTKKDYQQALDRLEIIFDAKKGTSAGDELELHDKLNIPTDVLIQAY